MHYVVFDLEFNQALNLEESKKHASSKCPFEIIQIGALKLDERLQIISSFNKLIKPELYTTLHPFVKQLTGITARALTSAEGFKEVYNEFAQFISSEDILCVWGTSDIKELMRNIRYHNLDASIFPQKHINIQAYASKHLHCPSGRNIGLRNAVELLNISLDGKFHDAFNDSYYTVEIFKHIYTPDITPVIYQANKEGRLTAVNKKSRLDTDKLIMQFEKMYNRQMTIEEQSIIKLAYMMGKTRQFLME